MSETEGPPDEIGTDRWQRRVSKGGAPSSSPEALQLSTEDEQRIAERAERAVTLSDDSTPQSRVSIQRIDDSPHLQRLTVDEMAADIDPPAPSIDLRDSVPDPDPDPSPASVVAVASGSSADTDADWPQFGLRELPERTDAAANAATSASSGSGHSGAAPTLRAPGSPRPEGRSGPALDPPTPPDLPTNMSSAPAAPSAPAGGVLGRQAEPTRPSRGGLLLVVAAGLAVLSGVLGALWLSERSETADLRAEVERAAAVDSVSNQGLDDLTNEVRTLELDNERLQQQLNDMSALVLELPEGRVTEIAVPFTPTFADEENGRLIAISEEGDYITFGEGADGPITDSGTISGSPTGLFAATRKAWIATDQDEVVVLSLVAGEPGLPAVDVGPTVFLAPEERGYWTYSVGTDEVVRRKKSDSNVTHTVEVPVEVVDLTIGAGSVWALGDDGRVYRINTADLTVSPLDAGVDLISVTAGPDALWTLSAADGSLRRVDPVTGDVLVTVPVGRDPIDATFAGSSVWVALRSGETLIEVDTRTSAVVSRTPLPSEPTALYQGDSGVFVTSDGEVPLVMVASLIPTAAPDSGAASDAADEAEDVDAGDTEETAAADDG